MGNMQVYDIMILIIVGWLTLRGVMKGMVSQLASLAAVILSFWSAVHFGPILEPIMRSAVNAQAPWDKVLAITIAFAGASIAVMLLQRVLAKIISAIRLKKFDHLCGALFGFLKGVLIGMIITFFAVMLSEQTRKMATDSHSGKVLVRLIQRTQDLLPEDVSALIDSNLEGFQQQIESGKETVEQLQEASKAGSEAKNAFGRLQDTLSNLFSKRTNETDAADVPPSLVAESEKSTKSSRPVPLSSQRPTTYAETTGTNGTSSTSGPQLLASLINDELAAARSSDQIRAARNASVEEPIPLDRFSAGYLSPSQLGVDDTSANGTSASSVSSGGTSPNDVLLSGITPSSASSNSLASSQPTTATRDAAIPGYTLTSDRTTRIATATSPGHASNRVFNNDLLIAPSAGMVPMTSVSGPSPEAISPANGASSTANGVSDWRVLMRNMR